MFPRIGTALLLYYSMFLILGRIGTLKASCTGLSIFGRGLGHAAVVDLTQFRVGGFQLLVRFLQFAQQVHVLVQVLTQKLVVLKYYFQALVNLFPYLSVFMDSFIEFVDFSLMGVNCLLIVLILFRNLKLNFLNFSLYAVVVFVRVIHSTFNRFDLAGVLLGKTLKGV